MSKNSKFRLLCLSNGHGEDIIAVRILQELRQISSKLNISALPLVGEGRAYFAADIPVIGSVQAMPSGGFIYMDGRQLVRDLQGGLLPLTWTQLKAMRTWVKDGSGMVLAVGDIVPLLFAWWSGANYAFVGTAKSEYYVRDGEGKLRGRDRLASFLRLNSSVYLPWERTLMSNSRCQSVFPRDRLTAKMLQKWQIPVFDLGNPMMDDLKPVQPLQISSKAELTVVLLPGSRVPEAYANWQQILGAVFSLIDTYRNRSMLFLGAISSQVNLDTLAQTLVQAGFCTLDHKTFNYKNTSIVLTQTAYNECLDKAEIAIAMAGTATEQFVGLGKPAIAFPGNGPQFTYTFAEAQSRHLGSSIILLEHPNQTGEAVKSLLGDHAFLATIAENGYKRMGKPGAARRIAERLIEQLEQGN